MYIEKESLVVVLLSRPWKSQPSLSGLESSRERINIEYQRISKMEWLNPITLFVSFLLLLLRQGKLISTIRYITQFKCS